MDCRRNEETVDLLQKSSEGSLFWSGRWKAEQSGASGRSVKLNYSLFYIPHRVQFLCRSFKERMKTVQSILDKLCRKSNAKFKFYRNKQYLDA